MGKTACYLPPCVLDVLLSHAFRHDDGAVDMRPAVVGVNPKLPSDLSPDGCVLKLSKGRLEGPEVPLGVIGLGCRQGQEHEFSIPRGRVLLQLQEPGTNPR